MNRLLELYCSLPNLMYMSRHPYLLLPILAISQHTLQLTVFKSPHLTKAQKSQSSWRYYDSRRKPNRDLCQPRESWFPSGTVWTEGGQWAAGGVCLYGEYIMCEDCMCTHMLHKQKVCCNPYICIFWTNAHHSSACRCMNFLQALWLQKM